MYCGKKVRLKPTKIRIAENRAQPSGYSRPAHLGPPEMDAAQIAHHRAADHDVMEVGHDEIRVVHMHIDGQRRHEQPRQPAHREQADEPQGIQHGRVEADRTLVQRGGPIEYFDGRGNRHQIAEQREDHAAHRPTAR